MSNHGLTVENLMRILPAVLARDKNVYALAEAIAEALVAELGNIDLVRIYARIDELPERLLDILAYDFKVDWWDGDYTLEQKRKTLKDSWRVHRMMGTRAAVELAVQAVFSSATVSEWFEYGGKPYYFRLSVDDTNILVTDEKPSEVDGSCELVQESAFPARENRVRLHNNAGPKRCWNCQRPRVCHDRDYSANVGAGNSTSARGYRPAPRRWAAFQKILSRR